MKDPTDKEPGRRPGPTVAAPTGTAPGAVETLAGRCLIAMPGMADPRFDASVIYICAHSDRGAMGIVVNRPTPDVRFADLLEQLDIAHDAGLPDIRVHVGGPVEPGRGFVLHSDDYVPGGKARPGGRSRKMPAPDHVSGPAHGGIAMTATIDVLADIAAGDGPASAMLALGYAGWGAGQLEGEFAANAWLTCPTTPELIFGRAHEFKWSAALKSIKVDPVVLSSTGGRA